jgi:hypothetical protein
MEWYVGWNLGSSAYKPAVVLLNALPCLVVAEVSEHTMPDLRQLTEIDGRSHSQS